MLAPLLKDIFDDQHDIIFFFGLDTVNNILNKFVFNECKIACFSFINCSAVEVVAAAAASQEVRPMRSQEYMYALMPLLLE